MKTLLVVVLASTLTNALALPPFLLPTKPLSHLQTQPQDISKENARRRGIEPRKIPPPSQQEVRFMKNQASFRSAPNKREIIQTNFESPCTDEDMTIEKKENGKMMIGREVETAPEAGTPELWTRKVQ